MTPFLTIEEKVQCLAQTVGEIKQQLHCFLAVADASLQSGLIEARKIIEYVVGRVLLQEGLKADRDLLNNIEILGGKEGKFPAQRRKDPNGSIPPPILPTPLYSSLHNLRIYGNLVAHPWDPQTMELKDVRLTSTDLQVALGQILRVIEWYFQEYSGGPHINPLYNRFSEPVIGRHSEAPPDTTSFLGRVGELDRFRQLLSDSSAKLITVLAPAGMGKTLLAAKAVIDLASHWANGRGLLMWFDLKGTPSFGEITARILANMQPDAQPTDLAIAQTSPGARVGQIVRGMADRPVLVVLDNFESWLDPLTRQPENPHVAQLLEQCATRSHQGQFVLTSRAAVEMVALPTASQATLTLGPLPSVDTRHLLLRQGIRGSDAAVADALSRLGGNPRLLIMLAEVLVKRGCQDLDLGLARFPSLVARAADGLLAEVWGQLTDAAKRTLQILAVLRPPARLTDLSAILAQVDPVLPWDVEDVLWNDVIPRALVIATEDGTAFSFEHLLIRDYSFRQWNDSSVPHRVALRHYQQSLENQAALRFPDSAHLAVIHHALAVEDYPLAAQTLTNEKVRKEMLRQGRYVELVELCRPIAAAVDRLPALARLQVRRLTAVCYENLGDYHAALELLEACRRDPADWLQTHEEAWLLTELCGVLRKLQRFEPAEAAGLEALAIGRRLENADSEAWALFELGVTGRPLSS